MAAYKAEATLARAAKSVLDQDYEHLALGIAIPGRDVATTEQARALRDQRVILIEQTGRGIADARNLVIGTIKADLYVLFDADDEMMPSTISTYVAHRLATGEPGLRFGHYQRRVVGGNEPDELIRTPFLGKISNAFPRLCLLNYVGAGCPMFDREVIDRIGAFDTRFNHAEDWHFWLRIAREFPLYGLDHVSIRYSYGKLGLAAPYTRAFFEDAKHVIDDVHPEPAVRLLSIMCIKAMYALYYFRTLRSRKTLVQLLDISIDDLLCLPPAAAVRILRGHGFI